MEDPLYEAWLKFLFDRPQEEGLPEWYWDIEVKDFEASNEQKVILIGKTFEHSGKDLLKYSDHQVANGINYIFNNAISNLIYLIAQKGVAEELRIDAVMKMKHLYADCFAKRCAPALGHLDEPNSNRLNGVCYMLWDVSPLCSWKSVVLDIMEYSLYLPNDACIESGLHGLGHRFQQDPERVPQIINKFLSKAKRLRPELRKYAHNAAIGCVQ